LTDVDVLRKTDISEYALEALAKSRIKRVRVVGRRGPMQVGYISVGDDEEEGMLMSLGGVHYKGGPRNAPAPVCLLRPHPSGPAASGTCHHVPSTASEATNPTSYQRLLYAPRRGDKIMVPRLSPVSSFPSLVIAIPISSVTCAIHANELDPSDPFSPGAKTTPLALSSGLPARVNIPANIFFRSIGYKSSPLPGFEGLGIGLTIVAASSQTTASGG